MMSLFEQVLSHEGDHVITDEHEQEIHLRRTELAVPFRETTQPALEVAMIGEQPTELLIYRIETEVKHALSKINQELGINITPQVYSGPTHPIRKKGGHWLIGCYISWRHTHP